MGEAVVVQGSVREGTDGRIPFLVPMRCRVTLLGRLRGSFVHDGAFETDDDGTFRYEFEIPEAALKSFRGPLRCLVALEAYAPDADESTTSFGFVVGHWGEIPGAINRHVSSLTYEVRLAGMRQYKLAISLDATDGTTTGGFEGVETLMCEVMYGHAPLRVGDLTVLYAASPIATAPALRGTSTFTAHAIVGDPGCLDEEDWEHFVRFSIAGTPPDGGIVARAWPMVGADAMDVNRFGALRVFEESIGADSLNARLADRYFTFPIVITDVAIELGDGEAVVRAGVGVGVSVDLVLFTIAEVAARVSVGFKDSGSHAFRLSELDNLFTIGVADVDVDLLPGTDLDELPAWVWVALAGLAPELSGAAALIAAVEALIKPIAQAVVERRVSAVLAAEVETRFNDEIDRLAERLAGVGVDRDTLLDGAWVQGKDIAIDVESVTVSGWAGIWSWLAQLLTDEMGDCPFEAASGVMETSALPSMRMLERVLADPGLEPWMDEYRLHSMELLRLVRRYPGLGASVARFTLAHAHDIASGRVSAKSVADFLAVVDEVQPTASPALGEFLGRIRGVVSRCSGVSLGEAKRVATEAAPRPQAAQAVERRAGQRTPAGSVVALASGPTFRRPTG